jgi:hypothetical protein
MAGRHPLIADVESETPISENQASEFVVDMERTHIFDKETEQAVC